MGGRSSLGNGAFRKRLMKFQGRASVDRNRLHSQGLNSQENRRGLVALKLWRKGPHVEKRSSWRK